MEFSGYYFLHEHKHVRRFQICNSVTSAFKSFSQILVKVLGKILWNSYIFRSYNDSKSILEAATWN